jgi:hypothetical protein
MAHSSSSSSGGGSTSSSREEVAVGGRFNRPHGRQHCLPLLLLLPQAHLRKQTQLLLLLVLLGWICTLCQLVPCWYNDGSVHCCCCAVHVWLPPCWEGPGLAKPCQHMQPGMG